MNVMAKDPIAALDGARRMSHGQQLARAAHKTPERIAFRFENQERTYAETDERVTRLARALARRGIGYGDRVATLMTNRIEVLESYFAVHRLGAIAVPVNFRLSANEAAYIIEDAGAKAIVVDAELAPLTAEIRKPGQSAISDLVCLVVGSSPERAGPGAEGYEDVLSASSAEELMIDVPESDPAFIMYTSGTTGRPKGAILSHFNLMINTFNMMSAMSMSGDDTIWLSGLPLFHIGCLDGILPYVMVGGTSVILSSGQFDAAQAVEMLISERATACLFVPAQWQAICAVPGVRERSFNLRRILTGGAVAPPSVIQAMIDSFPGIPIYNGFGQTEMSSVTCVLRGEDALRKMDSVGKPIVNVEARLVDSDTRDVPVGAVGEIVYRGPTVMQGYWGRPEATEEAFAGGWFHSGDLCRMDEDGYIKVVDRTKDMIVSGGENIYCAEVEAVIDGHAKVKEVALIGVADEKWGETPVAVIVPTDSSDPPSEAEIVAHCREHLASYKKPTAIIVVDELPRNASGKVLKTRLREQFGR
ncbi:MAG: long-chain-fatty-acid--CoA ligase [Actinomycetota bacterium]|nr:long-chain-fatty-acid--CoA ligase [Actinomycetota bacterium]